jgi:hypothetical protein
MVDENVTPQAKQTIEEFTKALHDEAKVGKLKALGICSIDADGCIGTNLFYNNAVELFALTQVSCQLTETLKRNINETKS